MEPNPTKDDLGKLYPIFLVPHDPEWEAVFAEEKMLLASVLGTRLRIEHIGSTAIPSISAKPTIDILVEQPEDVDAEQIIRRMARHGYGHMMEQKKHLAFGKGYLPDGLAKESFHVHIAPLSDGWIWDRVFFRDYLNDFPAEAMNYDRLKTSLAEKYTNDREAYTDEKAAYVAAVTRKAKAFYQLKNNKLMDLSISMIVALDENNGIGYKDALLTHISEDLKRFKRITTGHTVVMGRKTYDTLQVKPLPNRKNIVITANKKLQLPGCVMANSIDEAISLLDIHDENFIIGGGKVYEAFLPLADKLYLTRLHTTFTADTFFPEIRMEEWNETENTKRPADETRGFAFSYVTLERKE